MIRARAAEQQVLVRGVGGWKPLPASVARLVDVGHDLAAHAAQDRRRSRRPVCMAAMPVLGSTVDRSIAEVGLLLVAVDAAG